jgi:hypothetical protein
LVFEGGARDPSSLHESSDNGRQADVHVHRLSLRFAACIVRCNQAAPLDRSASPPLSAFVTARPDYTFVELCNVNLGACGEQPRTAPLLDLTNPEKFVTEYM